MFWYILGGIVGLSLLGALILWLRDAAPMTTKCVLAGAALEGALLLIYFIMKWTWLFTAMKIVGVITVALILLAVLFNIFKRL